MSRQLSLKVALILFLSAGPSAACDPEEMINELRAQTDLNKAIAELQRATGNSLTANNVTVQVR